MMTSEEPVLIALGEMLAQSSLTGEQQGMLLEWVGKEIHHRPLVATCDDGEYYWKLGELDPLSPTDAEGNVTEPRNVFAMLEWHEQRAVVIFAYAEVVMDGQKGILFYRDVVYNVKRTTGPVHHDALFRDLRAFLTGQEDDNPDGGEGDEGDGGQGEPGERAAQ